MKYLPTYENFTKNNKVILDPLAASETDKITTFLKKNKIKFEIDDTHKIVIDLKRNSSKTSVILSKLHDIAKFDELNEEKINEEFNLQWGPRSIYRKGNYVNTSQEFKTGNKFYMYVLDETILNNALKIKKHKPGSAFQLIQVQADKAFCKENAKDKWTEMKKNNKRWVCPLNKK